MSVSEWLERNADDVPRGLMAHAAQAVPSDTRDVTTGLVAAGTQSLARALAQGDARAAAADLLAGDAFFTWAMEAAAQDGTVPATAHHAILEIGTLLDAAS